jgi:hypothetical protein
VLEEELPEPVVLRCVAVPEPLNTIVTHVSPLHPPDRDAPDRTGAAAADNVSHAAASTGTTEAYFGSRATVR